MNEHGPLGRLAAMPFSRLSAILLIGMTLWMVRAHWETIDQAKLESKLALHEQVLANEADDPYQYKLWLISVAFDRIEQVTGTPAEFVFYANTLLSLPKRSIPRQEG